MHVQEIERRVVRHLIRTMAEHGWNISRIYDGGEIDEDVLNPTEDEAMDTVFGVDTSMVYFTNGKAAHVVQIVLGNDGYDCIADYSYSTTDDFEKLMTTKVDPYCDSLEN